MPLIPCPQCHKGVQVLQGSTGQSARCLACGREFVVRIPGEQPRRAAARSRDLSDYLPMIGVLGVSALLIFAMSCGLGLWFLLPPAPKKAGPPPAPLVKAAPDTPISREPLAGPLSWVPAHAIAAADKNAWKVTAEPTQPPAGLLSAFPLVHSARARVVFADAASARAGALQTADNPETSRWGLYLTIYDLRQTQPVAGFLTLPEWSTGPSSKLPLAGMSQSGKQVAVQRERLPAQVQVWSDDGKSVCTIDPPDMQIRRLLFAGDSRLLVDGRAELIAYELPSGRELYRLPAAEDTGWVISRGGKWMANVTPESIVWHSTADGSPAGSIDLGEHWKLPIRGDVKLSTPGFALHPDGRSLAILAWNQEQDLLVAHWDLEKGAPIEQFVVPVAHHGYKISFNVVWCGPRRMLINSGQVIDLDLKTWICSYDLSTVTDSPDGRRWGFTSLKQEQLAALAQKLKVPHPSSELALVAGTIPDERIAKRLAEAQKGVFFHPGFRLAVEADESVPTEIRQTLLTGLADALAAGGYVVDPAAPARARIVEAEADRVPNLTFDGRKFYRASAKITFLDASGREMLPYRYPEAQAAGRVDDAWVALAEEIKAKVQLPRLVLKDAAGADLEPRAELLSPGVDGTFAPGEVSYWFQPE